MTAWHMDNFSIYGTAFGNIDFGLNGIYSSMGRGTGNQYLGLAADPDGVSPGRVLYIDGLQNQHPFLRKAHPGGAKTKMGCTFRLWCATLPPADTYSVVVCEFLSVAAGSLMALTVSNTGRLRISSSGGQVAITSIPVISAQGWWHIEVFADQTNFEVRVEGVPVIGPIAHGMTTPDYAQWRVRQDAGGGGGGTTMNTYYKDLFCYDGGGSYNNNFVGSVLVHSLVPNSDVALNWTPTPAGTGYTILDNIPPNDAQYLTAPNPPPSPYKCTLTDLPADVTSVKALMTFVRAAKTDGGDGNLQVSLISDPLGTPATVNGADRPITVAQTYWCDVFEEDPKTTAPWLPSAVDAVNMQLNRTV